jgi:hypothetical protein
MSLPGDPAAPCGEGDGAAASGGLGAAAGEAGGLGDGAGEPASWAASVGVTGAVVGVGGPGVQAARIKAKRSQVAPT